MMKLQEFYSELSGKTGKRRDIILEKHVLHYRNGDFDFFKIRSRDIKSDDKVVLVAAGLHGEEIAGPLTLLRHFDRVIDYGHERGIKFVIYPLENPSGFAVGSRHNVDEDLGSEEITNDFLRYELKGGTIVDDIGNSNDFERWHWSSEPALGIRFSPEVALMHKLLKKDPLPLVRAAIDLHQDYITPDIGAAAYQYAFGDLGTYKDIIRKVKNLVPVLKNKDISAGQVGAMKTDNDGFIVRNDGVLADLFHRLGADYCVTVETSGKTPLDTACEVNLAWILGILDILSHENNKTAKIKPRRQDRDHLAFRAGNLPEKISARR